MRQRLGDQREDHAIGNLPRQVGRGQDQRHHHRHDRGREEARPQRLADGVRLVRRVLELHEQQHAEHGQRGDPQDVAPDALAEDDAADRPGAVKAEANQVAQAIDEQGQHEQACQEKGKSLGIHWHARSSNPPGGAGGEMIAP